MSFGTWVGSRGRRGAVLALAALGCAHGSARSPTDLRDAYGAAVTANDASAVYALLSPDLRARIPSAEFAARFAEDITPALAALFPPATTEPVYLGTTADDSGHVLEWTKVAGRYVVTHGLPGTPSTDTPARAIRAFLEAVDHLELAPLQSVLSERLAAAMREDWRSRSAAIETALDRPGALAISPDGGRAELRYDQGRALALERTPRGWRITALE